MNWLLSPGGQYRRGRAAAAIGSSYPKDKGLPNTLCHIALQMPAHRAAFSDKVLPWVVAGCIIPDIPWILLRTSLALDLAAPYTVRLYTTIQASLLFCALFSAFLAQLSRHPAATFAILTGNSLLHLLLDATQVKWANGVHLLAPFDWSAWQFNLFDIDHPLGIPLTIAGLITLLWSWPKILRQQIWAATTNPGRIVAAVICILLYLTGPLFFLDVLEQTDFHFLHTLKNKAARPGKYIEFDRVAYDRAAATVTIFSGETIRLEGAMPDSSGSVSIRGRFVSPDNVAVADYRMHSRFRDPASMLGIFLACVLTLQTIILPLYSHLPSQTKDATHEDDDQSDHSPPSPPGEQPGADDRNDHPQSP